jgi:prepilin-type N-terminal cleavage/methylation domain-containing protein
VSTGVRATIHRRARRGGFSLLESLLVVAIAALLTAIGAPLFLGYLADRALQNAGHLIQADLRLAQQLAISRSGSGPRVEMCFRADGYDIYAVDFADPLLRTGAVRSATVKAASASAAGQTRDYPAGITVSVDATATVPCLLDPSRGAIAFSGAGRPISFADASPKDITLGLRGRTYRVTVAPITGRATVGR